MSEEAARERFRQALARPNAGTRWDTPQRQAANIRRALCEQSRHTCQSCGHVHHGASIRDDGTVYCPKCYEPAKEPIPA